ncbi:unnamed protein product [Amoebophrya sp. A25]|nr:unnamed protein product [Amoebophrya sp. A25]|eukprot:GSA25T00028068001.1
MKKWGGKRTKRKAHPERGNSPGADVAEEKLTLEDFDLGGGVFSGGRVEQSAEVEAEDPSEHAKKGEPCVPVSKADTERATGSKRRRLSSSLEASASPEMADASQLEGFLSSSLENSLTDGTHGAFSGAQPESSPSSFGSTLPDGAQNALEKSKDIEQRKTPPSISLSL